MYACPQQYNVLLYVLRMFTRVPYKTMRVHCTRPPGIMDVTGIFVLGAPAKLQYVVNAPARKSQLDHERVRQ